MHRDLVTVQRIIYGDNNTSVLTFVLTYLLDIWVLTSLEVQHPPNLPFDSVWPPLLPSLGVHQLLPTSLSWALEETS